MTICKVAHCDREASTKGMCQAHYVRFWKTGSAMPEKPFRSMHGMGGTKVYWAWRDALRRCHDPRSASFKRYGGRGITVCPEWRSSVMAFFQDMGSPAGKHYQLDRIDNELGYFKENCRWVPPFRNAQNRSSTKLDEKQAAEIKSANGTQGKIAKAYGVSQATVSAIRLGKRWRANAMEVAS